MELSNPAKPDISEEELSGSDSMPISGRFISSIIAKNLEMDINDFNRYNPGFDDMLAIGGTFNMRLPMIKCVFLLLINIRYSMNVWKNYLQKQMLTQNPSAKKPQTKNPLNNYSRAFFIAAIFNKHSSYSFSGSLLNVIAEPACIDK